MKEINQPIENFSDSALTIAAENLRDRLIEKKLTITTAESCTGGWVAKCLTDIAGSSHWFDRGFVTYTNQSKQEMLGIEQAIIEENGAVSEPTVRAMVQGALQHSQADVALAISGIAGPGGGTNDKPVGMVWFAWAGKAGLLQSENIKFNGNREAVRRQAVLHALQTMLSLSN